jgi:hypothetical protein
MTSHATASTRAHPWLERLKLTLHGIDLAGRLLALMILGPMLVVLGSLFAVGALALLWILPPDFSGPADW